ncbi:MAG: Yip1 family protein [Gallionella sp.]
MNLNTATVKSYFKGLLDLATRLIVNPVDFFRTMPRSGGLLDPMFYLVMTVLLDVMLFFVESSASHGAGINDLGMLVVSLIIVALIALILSFFVAGIFFAIWSFMGSGESYETSYRCLAYMQTVVPVAILLSIVPYLGLLGVAWWLYLMVTATRVVHNLPAKPALLVFGIIAALSGLVYFNSVSSAIKAKQRLQEFTRELQKIPGKNDTGNSGKR